MGFEWAVPAQGAGQGGPWERVENDGSRGWAPPGNPSRELSIFTPPASARSTPKVSFSEGKNRFATRKHDLARCARCRFLKEKIISFILLKNDISRISQNTKRMLSTSVVKQGCSMLHLTTCKVKEAPSGPTRPRTHVARRGRRTIPWRKKRSTGGCVKPPRPRNA